MRTKSIENKIDDELLNLFNNRDVTAFSRIYTLYYDDLYYFAQSLYSQSEISADDVVQDVFLGLWEATKNKFETLLSIKAFLVISIKNRFKNYLDHRKSIDKHTKAILSEDDYFVTQIVETEFVSLLRNASELLPEECAKVFIEYLNGFDVKEIAERLHKSEFTVYKQKTKAISILKTKLSKDKLLIIMLMLP
ncbi:MAG: sigma-70 family RNA polymerase sigma factor [Rikenellaceae bacterium]